MDALLLAAAQENDDLSVNLIWVLVVLAIIALIVFIFSRFRR